MNEELLKFVTDTQNLMKKASNGVRLTEEEESFLNKATIRLARHLPSPSKLNAASIYQSNEAEKVASYIEYLERGL
jgi:hypothetical protein